MSKGLKALKIIVDEWLYETRDDYVFANIRIDKQKYDSLKEVL